MKTKKGQTTYTGGNAATLVAIITVLILLYLLFLPPDERSKLLDDTTMPGSTSGGNTISGGQGTIDQQLIEETLFTVTPGVIDYTDLNQYEHELPSINLQKRTDSTEIETLNAFYVRSGWFEKINKNFSFKINDIENTDNIFLSFNAKKYKGVLTIKLNGNEIYSSELTSSSPGQIKLAKNYLQNENTLSFSVNSVGVAFWTTNEYQLEQIKIIGDVTDISRQASKMTFFVTEGEWNNLDTATLRFNPYCNTNDAGKLSVLVNRKEVFSGVPDCDALNKIDLYTNSLQVGKNSVDFQVDSGSYLIDQILVKTELKENANPIYFFDIDDKLFINSAENPEEECGRVDGVCPSFCGAYADIDCCLVEIPNGYWCDVPTRNSGDRCVGAVAAEDCARCQSGYEDKSGNAPDECEKKCGDDKDGECITGCSPEYDKDCCFDLSGDQYWCSNLPTTGVSYTCVNSVSYGECDTCPGTYKGKNKDPKCIPKEELLVEEQVKPGYNVRLNIEFTNNVDTKELELFINGRMIRIDTNTCCFEKDITDMVEAGTNSIELVPLSKLSIKTLDIILEK